MGRITSNIGLITGIPIQDTVDQLIGVAGAPRDLLSTRNQGLQQQQLAINSLSTRLLGLQFDLGKLNVSDPYEARTVSSQNEEVLSAVLSPNGEPSVGEFQIRTVQTATSQQLVSQRFEDVNDIQGGGTFSFGFGGFVNRGISLDQLNSGIGVARGQIKITDLSGTSAVIDLSTIRTVDDVLDAINAETTLNVTASINGDKFELSDNVGGTSTLTVQEVAGGTTATDLGLDGISTTATTATGADIFSLHAGIKLSRLNDGNGVRFTEDLTDIDDLTITLLDGTSAGVDLSGTSSLGEVIAAIQDDDDFIGKIKATIGGDGNRLELTDLTTGGGTFAIANGVTGSAADDLGLTTTAASGVITGSRLVSGVRDTLLSSLNGGTGLGTLGSISIADRTGGSDTTDLSSAETLSEIVDLINGLSVDVTAAINSAGNGISITDTSGGGGNLVVSNNDTTNSADTLKIAVDADQVSIDSGTLNRQTLSEATLLATLGGGLGLSPSDIAITDTNGQSSSIDLNASGAEAKTVGDVIDAINAASVGVAARINDTGDGIQITDTALGSDLLSIKDINGTLAADLNLTRTSETVDLDGIDTQIIDGTNGYSVDLSNLDGAATSISLASLREGAGIDFSDIKITDSQGKVLALDLNGEYSGITTIGQFIDAINNESVSQNVGVTASINSSETGILLTDTAGGASNLQVEDVNGTAAADLRILSTPTTTTTVDGINLFSATNESLGALEIVANRINDLDSGVTASTFFDGIGYRLSLAVNQTGSANEILLDAKDSGFSFAETSSARDALITLGAQATLGSGVLISSQTNDFDDVIAGINLSVVSASDEAVSVTVAKSDADFVALVEDFVESYNAIRNDLNEFTSFDENDLSTGLLIGTNEALRVDTELSRLTTDRYSNVGSFESFEEIGLSIDDQGKLQLNKSELQQAFADNPESLKSFFTDESRGVVAKFSNTIERLAGADNGLLTNRNDSLQATIDINSLRIERLNESLDRQRERLLLQFFQLEQVVAGLQQNLTALGALQTIPPLGRSG
jgi:flagellar hook-associated protein 2